MLRSCLICGALALIVSSVRGEEGVPPSLKTIEQQQKELLAKVTQIQSDITSLKDRLERIDAGKGAGLDAYEITSKLGELHAEISKLRSELQSGRQSTSGFSPMPQVPGEPSPKRESLRLSSGTVRLTNDFVSTQVVIVNGLAYTIQPGEVREIFVTPGEFTYKLEGESSLRASSVPQGYVKAIRIFVQ
jgi:hypothetical protein